MFLVVLICSSSEASSNKASAMRYVYSFLSTDLDISNFDSFKVNLYHGGVMQRDDGIVRYTGRGLKKGIVVDPDYMTWSCFDGFCEVHEIPGGIVERVWYKLPHEDMDTVRSFGFHGSDSELMIMCAQAMSESEVDVFIQQGDIVLLRTEKENRENAEKQNEENVEMPTEMEDDISEKNAERESEENGEKQTDMEEDVSDEDAESEKNGAEHDETEGGEDKEYEEAIKARKERELEEAMLLKKRKKGKAKILEDEEDIGERYEVEIEDAEAVLEYALKKGKNIEQNRWDKTKIGYKCGEDAKCKWKLYFSYDKSSGMWILKTKYGYHTCTPGAKCKLLKGPVIAKLFLDKLREKTKLWPLKIQALIKEHWDSKLRDIMKHKGSTAIVDTYRNAEKKGVFDRFFVCFEKLRTRWKSSCRPVIGLDGTFFKIAVKGTLLTAVGHDANNQIYPIAWAVVQSENGDNWLWFVKNLKADLGLEDGDGYVMISDRCKGLLSAVKAELPKAEHRMCVKHIVENLKKNHAKKDLLKNFMVTVLDLVLVRKRV
ncbi:unnamed protein product [Microthlaspi erraticum]|uniref:MULE transposase domain-containing protein n=1 Tax=Microthlaspi erraticum TaxID=1685480 RepID=A0A6D2JSI8_9BRAS|nr:unnamed protein product [Microthlaspi erraticum]CAA7041437.1 unnamed protein product [Microthlaspi erraticum]CAA7042366.1 unnamed protein product [Microthlaspi erraticum]CAA7053136.1 unnamed protein product [Microthlaspi erraticum]